MPLPNKIKTASAESASIANRYFYNVLPTIGCGPCRDLGRHLAAIAMIALAAVASADTIELDQRPAGSSDWGYRPADGARRRHESSELQLATAEQDLQLGSPMPAERWRQWNRLSARRHTMECPLPEPAFRSRAISLAIPRPHG